MPNTKSNFLEFLGCLLSVLSDSLARDRVPSRRSPFLKRLYPVKGRKKSAATAMTTTNIKHNTRVFSLTILLEEYLTPKTAFWLHHSNCHEPLRKRPRERSQCAYVILFHGLRNSSCLRKSSITQPWRLSFKSLTTSGFKEKPFNRSLKHSSQKYPPF